MIAWLRKCASQKQPTSDVVITFTSEGFTVLLSDLQETHVEWSDIRHVRIFKQDLFMTDRIVIELRRRSASSVQLGEDDIDLQVLLQQLELFLPKFKMPQDWFGKVAFPPFKRCQRELWTRAD